MAERPRDPIELLATGVPGLDEVLGGGLPEYSFNLIAGGPGAGKTTLALQTMFAIASAERPALYFTLLGEPTLKLLRYQRQFSFFDAARVGTEIRFINLSEEVLLDDLGQVLERIVAEVERTTPSIVVIDSFRTLARSGPAASGRQFELEQFVQRLALHLTTWSVTSFLVGEYTDQEVRNPIFTVADGILWLFQAVDRNSVVRKLQVIKMRGLATMPGLHTIRMTDDGLQVFPRIPERPKHGASPQGERMSTGIAGLDDMMGGGIPAGDSIVIAGPTGSGKTTFGTQFVAEGLRSGESAVIAVFEEHPDEYLRRTKSYGVDLAEAVRRDKLKIIYLRPLDLSVDETLEEIRSSVRRLGATRVVIDSLSGFEMALAPTFREDFRESLYRLVSALTGVGVTVLMTVETVGDQGDIQFSNYQVSFLTDDIIMQRYVEIEGQLQKVLAVVKMRGSRHSRDFRAYEITATGIHLGELLRGYDAISSGIPKLEVRLPEARFPGLTRGEVLVLEMLTLVPDASTAELAQRIGAPLGELEAAVGRLLELGYVSRGAADDRYRAMARPNTS